MKKRLLVCAAIVAIGLFIGFGAGISFARSQEREREGRFREWQERRREVSDADARVALEARLVKIETEIANCNRRLDWMEKVVWGAIFGMVAIFARELLSVYFNRQHRQDQAQRAGPE